MKDVEKTAVHNCCPEARKVAVISADVLPDAPPKTNTVIGADIMTAINVMIKPDNTVLGTLLK